MMTLFMDARAVAGPATWAKSRGIMNIAGNLYHLVIVDKLAAVNETCTPAEERTHKDEKLLLGLNSRFINEFAPASK